LNSNSNVLALILFAFAAGLMTSSVSVWAQQGTNVTTPSGETEEVPTLVDAIQTNLQSLIALIASIIALIGLIIKSGILDPWIDKKKQDQFYTSAQAGLVTMKKALEDKTLNKFILDQITPLIPEDRRKKAIEVSSNIDDQMNATNEQLQYYYEKLKDKVGQKNMDKKVNPDLNRELPRESHNVANDMGPIPDRIGQKVSTTKHS
jgi:exosome complex RNA-binding protein Rrp42 (RNase PH superfamily)